MILVFKKCPIYLSATGVYTTDLVIKDYGIADCIASHGEGGASEHVLAQYITNSKAVTAEGIGKFLLLPSSSCFPAYSLT